MVGEYPDIPYIGPPKSYGTTSYGKRYIGVHNTSNDANAREEASYATRRTDGTSSHYYGDPREVVQSLHTAYGANHAGSTMANRYAISYEYTGVNGWTRAQWLSNINWGLASRQTARDCAKYSIPVRLLTVAQMRAANVPGFVTHDLMRQAWGGTDHTDPGPNFPMDHLMSLTSAHLNPAVPVILEGEMFLSKGSRGEIYASSDDLMKRRLFAPSIDHPNVQAHLPFLVAHGATTVWKPVRQEPASYAITKDGFGVWGSSDDLFGPLDSPVDSKALAAALTAPLAAAILAGLPPATMTPEQVQAACEAAVTGMKLGR